RPAASRQVAWPTRRASPALARRFSERLFSSLEASPTFSALLPARDAGYLTPAPFGSHAAMRALQSA
ncbi:hypothetical protein, partial [Pantoea ananatis]|uniref:hypothetical protein n=1 Tax=Pantoea ananas TaxID=553 RepID=UPI001B312405